jgi:hypothetical protein
MSKTDQGNQTAVNARKAQEAYEAFKADKRELWLPPKDPEELPETQCFTAKVAMCDLGAAMRMIERHGTLLSVTASHALRRLNRIHVGCGYVIVYEAAQQLEWEALT